MDVFTVSLFGHRRVEDLTQLENRLVPVVRDLINSKPYVAFMLGRNGEFDEYAASVIKRVIRERELNNSDITLVLPYTVSDIEYYEKYYDNVIIPECLYGVHPKSAITQRNRWMIDNSDTVIFYLEHNSGGAYSAMKFARKIGRDYITV